MTKKYKLKCFGCGDQFKAKLDVHRLKGYPYCDECYYDRLSSEEDAYREENFMKQWYQDHPHEDYDQWQIDQANIRKYGEY